MAFKSHVLVKRAICQQGRVKNELAVRNMSKRYSIGNTLYAVTYTATKAKLTNDAHQDYSIGPGLNDLFKNGKEGIDS
jgi:hypothetical protein